VRASGDQADFFLRSVSRGAGRGIYQCRGRLYLISWLLGAIVYLYFKIDVQPNLERDRHWHAMGYLDLKEDFVAIGLGLLPAYWFCWRRPVDGQDALIRAAVTILLAFIIWWSFLVGHVVNNIGGFGW
jgi:hypothetical protein